MPRQMFRHTYFFQVLFPLLGVTLQSESKLNPRSVPGCCGWRRRIHGRDADARGGARDGIEPVRPVKDPGF
jgi:hypothetical protein